MKKHTLIFVFLIFALAFPLFANSSKETSSPDEMRIVTLAPNITELVCEIGGKDSLVGISNSCTGIKECPCKTTVGDMWKPDTETIVSLEPSIVIASSLTDDSSLKALEDAGINAVKINYDQRLDGTYDLVREVGKLIGKEKEAEKLAEDLKERIEAVSEKTDSINYKKSVVYLISWGEWGDYAATGDTFIGDIIEKAGGINAARSASYWAISKELLLSEDPDVIILPSYSYSEADIEGFKSTSPYSSLSGKVITIDGDMAERQGLRTADFAETLASTLYPELF